MNVPAQAPRARRADWWSPVLALVAACAVPAAMWVALADLGEGRAWAVDAVEVVGLERLDDGEVLQVVGLDRPRNVLSCRAGAMEDALEAHPWIAHAQVDVSLLGRVEIHIAERRPAFVVLSDGAALVDTTGAMIRAWSPLEDVDVPMFVPSAEPGGLGAARVHAARRLVSAWSARPSLPELREVHDLGVHGWRVVDVDGVETLLPPRHPAHRLDAVARVRLDAQARSLSYDRVRADGADSDRITLATLAPLAPESTP